MGTNSKQNNSISVTDRTSPSLMGPLLAGFDFSVFESLERGEFSSSEQMALERKLARWSLRCEGKSPAEILAFASEQFGTELAFPTDLGVEGCLLVDLVGRQRLPVDVFVIDTGVLFPETYELWRELEARYGLTIRTVKSPLALHQQANIWGENLWERDSRRCCELRRKLPLRQELEGFKARISIAHPDATSDKPQQKVFEWDARNSLVTVHPLAFMSSGQIWSEVQERHIPHNPLQTRNIPSMGCEPCTSLAGDKPGLKPGRIVHLKLGESLRSENPSGPARSSRNASSSAETKPGGKKASSSRNSRRSQNSRRSRNAGTRKRNHRDNLRENGSNQQEDRALQGAQNPQDSRSPVRHQRRTASAKTSDNRSTKESRPARPQPSRNSRPSRASRHSSRSRTQRNSSETPKPAGSEGQKSRD